MLKKVEKMEREFQFLEFCTSVRKRVDNSLSVMA